MLYKVSLYAPRLAHTISREILPGTLIEISSSIFVRPQAQYGARANPLAQKAI